MHILNLQSTDNMPAEIGLLSLPSGEKLRSARIHNVAEAQMFWQHSGQRLAVHTMRYVMEEYRFDLLIFLLFKTSSNRYLRSRRTD